MSRASEISVPVLTSASLSSEKVAADAVAQDLRLADVDDLPAGVLVQIHAGREGELRYLFAEFHRREAII